MQQGDRIPPVKTTWYPRISPKRYSPNIFSRALQNIWTLINTIASILRENMNGYVSLDINFWHPGTENVRGRLPYGRNTKFKSKSRRNWTNTNWIYDNPHWHKLISCRYAPEDWRRVRGAGRVMGSYFLLWGRWQGEEFCGQPSPCRVVRFRFNLFIYFTHYLIFSLKYCHVHIRFY